MNYLAYIPFTGLFLLYGFESIVLFFINQDAAK